MAPLFLVMVLFSMCFVSSHLMSHFGSIYYRRVMELGLSHTSFTLQSSFARRHLRLFTHWHTPIHICSYTPWSYAIFRINLPPYSKPSPKIPIPNIIPLCHYSNYDSRELRIVYHFAVPAPPRPLAPPRQNKRGEMHPRKVCAKWKCYLIS